MKKGKRKRIKINYKRFVLSFTIFAIIAILTTNVLKQIFANYHDKDKSPFTKEVVASGDIDKENKTDNLLEERSELYNEDEKTKGKEDLEETNKLDEVKKAEPLTDEVEDSNINKFNDYKEVFKDSLFLGDSITDSLSFYEFVDKSNVVAKFGLTAKGAKDEIQGIIKINPKNIFIMFGMNDILTGEDSNKFANNYAELIQDVKEKLPNTKIYIQSILPVDSKVKDKKPLLTNENIDKFNQVLEDVANNENVEYLNIRTILEKNENLLEPDGIHVKYKFYKLWLDYLIENNIVEGVDKDD